jgi:hypothetical protein
LKKKKPQNKAQRPAPLSPLRVVIVGFGRVAQLHQQHVLDHRAEHRRSHADKRLRAGGNLEFGDARVQHGAQRHGPHHLCGVRQAIGEHPNHRQQVIGINSQFEKPFDVNRGIRVGPQENQRVGIVDLR